jgi:hypothetical protein
MEAILLMLDMLALALLAFTSLRNDRRGAAERQIGLFRYRESKPPAPPAARRPR